MILKTRSKRYKKEMDRRKTNSIKAKDFDSPLERQQFLDKIREKEQKRNLYPLNLLGSNSVSDFFGISGVYILFNADVIVYVGESSCILSRLSNHFGLKSFDSFKIIPIADEAERLKLEKSLIKKYSPLYNITHNPLLNNPQPILKVIS